MKKNWPLWSTGFALFSMFFGSGNLVFPITIGLESRGHYLLGTLGLFLTGVVVPLLGMFGMVLHRGSIQSFFSCFGKKGTFLFSLLVLGLLGPFGVVARCLVVAHGALDLILPNVSLFVSGLCFSLMIYLLTINQTKIIAILGTYLTPFLLLSIGAIFFFAIQKEEIPISSEQFGWSAFTGGFFQGYQTMDLFAAFFFSKLIIKQLEKTNQGIEHNKETTKFFLKSSCLGAFLLSIVYLGLVFLGWIYSKELVNQPPPEMLGLISQTSLGKFASPFVSIAIILACLTTAVALSALFADFLRLELCQGKIGRSTSLMISLFIALLVSTLDFVTISQFLSPLLEAIYPALIILTISNLFNFYYKLKNTHWPFTLVLLAKILLKASNT